MRETINSTWNTRYRSPDNSHFVSWPVLTIVQSVIIKGSPFYSLACRNLQAVNGFIFGHQRIGTIYNQEIYVPGRPSKMQDVWTRKHINLFQLMVFPMGCPFSVTAILGKRLEALLEVSKQLMFVDRCSLSFRNFHVPLLIYCRWLFILLLVNLSSLVDQL